MSSAIHLKMDGCPYRKGSKLSYPHLQLEVIKSPHDYKDGVSQRDWDYIGSIVKSMQTPLCQGGIGSAFFTKDKHRNETSLVFILYGVPKKDRKNIYAFAICNDYSKKRHFESRENKEKALYIEAICANAKQIREDRRVVTEVSMGKILINRIEQWGLKHGNDSVKLSAIPYVTQYYRKLGYRHINAGEAEENEKVEIANAAKALAGLRFKNDELLLQAHKVELALSHQSLGNAKERLEQQLRSLNKYIPEYLFVEGGMNNGDISVLPRGYDLEDLNMDFKEDRQTVEDIESLERVVNEKRLGVERAYQAGTLDDNTFQLKRYFRLLVANGFAVDCPTSKTERLMIEFGPDEADLACDSNGYTMRKRLRPKNQLIECSRRISKKGGRRTRKNKYH